VGRQPSGRASASGLARRLHQRLAISRAGCCRRAGRDCEPRAASARVVAPSSFACMIQKWYNLRELPDSVQVRRRLDASRADRLPSAAGPGVMSQLIIRSSLASAELRDPILIGSSVLLSTTACGACVSVNSRGRRYVRVSASRLQIIGKLLPFRDGQCETQASFHVGTDAICRWDGRMSSTCSETDVACLLLSLSTA